MSLADYHGSAGDWREQIRKNQRRTRTVIGLFVGVYFVVGFIADIVVLQTMYPGITVQQSMNALTHFRVIPYATLLMVGFAAISLLITYSLYDRIMLLGTEYREITPENAQNVQEQQLYNVVEEMTVAAGLQYVPKVFIIEAD